MYLTKTLNINAEDKLQDVMHGTRIIISTITVFADARLKQAYEIRE